MHGIPLESAELEPRADCRSFPRRVARRPADGSARERSKSSPPCETPCFSASRSRRRDSGRTNLSNLYGVRRPHRTRWRAAGSRGGPRASRGSADPWSRWTRSNVPIRSGERSSTSMERSSTFEPSAFRASSKPAFVPHPPPPPREGVRREDTGGPSSLRFERIEPVPGTDIEDGLAIKPLRQPDPPECRQVVGVAGGHDPVSEVDGVPPLDATDLGPKVRYVAYHRHGHRVRRIIPLVVPIPHPCVSTQTT